RTAAHRHFFLNERILNNNDRLTRPYAFLRACFTKSSKVMVFPDFFRTASTLFSAAAFGRPSVSKADNASLRKVLCAEAKTGGCDCSQLSFFSLSFRSMMTR